MEYKCEVVTSHQFVTLKQAKVKFLDSSVDSVTVHGLTIKTHNEEITSIIVYKMKILSTATD